MNSGTLRARRLGVDTYRQPVLFMRADSYVVRSEGFEALTRVKVQGPDRWIVATLMVLTDGLLEPGEAGLSDEAWRLLGVSAGDALTMSHPPVLESFAHVRTKMYGGRLEPAAVDAIVRDIALGLYSDVHIAAFVSACAADRLDRAEVVALTRAMVASGERLEWGDRSVVDKHCVGGLPGNRTTPIVVAVAAAAGLTIPKTSSRAITSPAGTADVMETMTTVELSLDRMRAVVDACGGCLAWGGAVQLSPVDDLLIRVESALDVDSEGQLVASVLSKKVAAGADRVVIDLPWGPTAKVRSWHAAEALATELVAVGEEVGLDVRAVLTDGRQPVGRGLGPALEAHDVLAVLRREPGAPQDLRQRALALAGCVLEHGGAVPDGGGEARATQLLDDGSAWDRFVAICEAQGGFRAPPRAPHTEPVLADRSGVVVSFDNRRLARVAKLAGAPADPAAGLSMACRIGDRIAAGQPLFVVHAESRGERDYALDYVRTHRGLVHIAEAP